VWIGAVKMMHALEKPLILVSVFKFIAANFDHKLSGDAAEDQIGVGEANGIVQIASQRGVNGGGDRGDKCCLSPRSPPPFTPRWLAICTIPLASPTPI
jgi:hypothetical protein